MFQKLLFLLLFVDVSSLNKTQELQVTCLVSAPCVLPCFLPPAPLQQLLWFRQDSLILTLSSDLRTLPGPQDPLEGRAGLSAVTEGNASLLLRDSTPKDRGRYRCSVTTNAGERHQEVIVKVQAPVRDLSVELSRLSGFEEMKCLVRDVFPPPRVTWSTEPPTFHDLRPLTRKQLEASGLYEVDSRLRPLEQTDLVYICTATSPYGGERWSASYRHRELRGEAGKDLTLPCLAPSYMNSRTLSWTFSSDDAPERILTYDIQSGKVVWLREWAGHAELDGFRVQFGDGSLRLMDPDERRHAGRYSCQFSADGSTHTERLEVDISGADRSVSEESSSHWWILGLVIVVAAFAAAAILVFLKLRGGTSKPKSDHEEATELHTVTDLSSRGTNGQS